MSDKMTAFAFKASLLVDLQLCSTIKDKMMPAYDNALLLSTVDFEISVHGESLEPPAPLAHIVRPGLNFECTLVTHPQIVLSHIAFVFRE